MTSKTFEVPNISCAHCTHTVKMELEELPGVESVTADVDTRLVSVTWSEPATWESITTLLAEINYPPAE